MKLRFEVDQAECFRRGIDCPKSIVTIDVNPAELPQDVREMIADRLSGIDVCHLTVLPGGGTEIAKENGAPVRIKAWDPTFESLLVSVRECKEWVDERIADKKKSEKRIAKMGGREKAIDAVLGR
jgi:hypothetical protein